MKILKVFLLSFALLSAFGLVNAEETVDVAEIIALDENVTAQDLGISEPNLLPDSPFYFFKNWGREIQSTFTFNPVKKAELREKFANEKLIELKKVAEKTQNSQVIKKATENYQKEVEKIKEATERIKETAEENVQVGQFLDKFIQQQILHQRVLQKLESQVPEEAFAKIQEARKRHIENFGEVMTKLEERKEQLQERLEKNLEEIRGSEFKHFKNLEVLLELEENVPEQAKEAIRNAQENALKRLKEDLEQMSEEDQEKFKEYIENIGGIKERHMEILENLKEELEDRPLLQQKLLQLRETILERVEEKMEERGCPEIEKPAPGFCEKGRIIFKKDEKGCVIDFSCVIPAELRETGIKACITLWNPVCGVNDKTYSNECFAELDGVEIAHKGICEKSLIRPSPLPEEPKLCAQVITYRKNPETGECQMFPTPCYHEDWEECVGAELLPTE